MIPTTPSLPSRFTRSTMLPVMFFPKKGDEGPNSTSKIIAIAISNRPKSIISRKICFILDIIDILFHFPHLCGKWNSTHYSLNSQRITPTATSPTIPALPS